FTPLEALQSATIVPAKVSGRERNIGSIEVGKLADIVILDADPLESISNIRKTRYVVAMERCLTAPPFGAASGSDLDSVIGISIGSMLREASTGNRLTSSGNE